MENKEKTNFKEIKYTIPIYEQIIFYIGCLIISLVIAFFFLKYFVNMKEISKIIFSFCYIYFTFFFFFQFVFAIDYVICYAKDKMPQDQVDFATIFIENYYIFFNWLGYFLRFLFFPICSGFLQSGYIKTKKRFLDAIFYHYIFLIKEFYVSHCILFYILIIIALGLVGGLVIIIIFYTNQAIDFYGNYNSVILNSLNFLTLIEIYMNTGFFIIHNFIDCRRKCKKNIDYNYNIRLVNIIFEKLNKDIDKMNKTYEALCNEIAKTNIKTLEPNYYQKISLLIDKAKENNEIYKINFIGQPKNNSFTLSILEDKKEDDKLNSLIENDIYKINEDNYIINEKQKIINIENNINNHEEKGIEIISTQNNIDNIEKELSPHIRKFKKYLRKIPKYKFLFEKVKNRNDILTNCQKIKLYIRYIIYYIVIIFIVFYEFICIKTKEERDKENARRKLEENDDDSLFEFILSFFLIFILIFIFSFYTIAVIYSLYWRNFVSGDLLYGKHLGDNLNLTNTTKTISGLATVLSYCNFYMYYYLIKNHPKLYDFVKFPEYDIGRGYNFFGVIRFSFLIIFGIIANSFKKIFCFKISDFGSTWKYLC